MIVYVIIDADITVPAEPKNIRRKHRYMEDTNCMTPTEALKAYFQDDHRYTDLLDAALYEGQES